MGSIQSASIQLRHLSRQSAVSRECHNGRTINAVFAADDFSKWIVADLGSDFSLKSIDVILQRTVIDKKRIDPSRHLLATKPMVAGR
jgi:hypothetical protein